MDHLEALDDYLDALGLQSLAGVEPADSDSVERSLMNLSLKVPRGGKQLIGLGIAFASMAEEAIRVSGSTEVDEPLERFGRDEVDSKGRPVNTLNLRMPDKSFVRLRKTYEGIRDVARNDLRRYDYPNSAPHATQAWSSNTDLLNEVFGFTPAERRAFVEGLWDLLTAMPAQRPRAVGEAAPRPFEVLLEKFPGTQKGEPAGAILQGLAFAYYRADSPTVTIDTGKAKAGSKTTGRVGDVDGWDGERLAISVEVKDKDLERSDEGDLGSFVANLSDWPDAIAVVVARSATGEVIRFLSEQDVRFFDRDAMLRTVKYWDLGKQSLATREFLYYLVHIEQSSSLIERFRAFCREHELDRPLAPDTDSPIE